MGNAIGTAPEPSVKQPKPKFQNLLKLQDPSDGHGSRKSSNKPPMEEDLELDLDWTIYESHILITGEPNSGKWTLFKNLGFNETIQKQVFPFHLLLLQAFYSSHSLFSLLPTEVIFSISTHFLPLTRKKRSGKIYPFFHFSRGLTSKQDKILFIYFPIQNHSNFTFNLNCNMKAQPRETYPLDSIVWLTSSLDFQEPLSQVDLSDFINLKTKEISRFSSSTIRIYFLFSKIDNLKKPSHFTSLILNQHGRKGKNICLDQIQPNLASPNLFSRFIIIMQDFELDTMLHSLQQSRTLD